MSDIPDILMIPVNAITVLNPRARNKRVFQELVTSIERLGLKKPITVSQRPGRSRYDLVCGQGRLEAFMALGQESIPAVVIDAAEGVREQSRRHGYILHLLGVRQVAVRPSPRLGEHADDILNDPAWGGPQHG